MQQSNPLTVDQALRSNVVAPELWAAMLTVGLGVAYAAMLPSFGFDPRAAATVAAVGSAALLSGIAGFAFSAICGAIVFQFRSDTVDVVQIMLVCSIANQAMSVWALRDEIRLHTLTPFLAGGAAGVCAGVWLLLHIERRAYEHWLGVILLTYGSYMLFRKPLVLRRSPLAGDVLSGFVGGVMGGFAATPGAAVSIWCGMKGWDKAAQRAVFQPFILAMQILALALIASVHARSGTHLRFPALAPICVPAGLMGTWWGLACFRRLTDRHFRIAINLLLIVSGVGLVL